MSTWFLLNCLFSLSVFCVLAISRSAPPRVRFKLCFMALCAWLVPWQWVTAGLASIMPEITQPLSPWIMILPSSQETTVSPALGLSIQRSAEWILAAAFIPGIILFLRHLIGDAWLLRRIQRTATRGDHLWHVAGLEMKSLTGCKKVRLLIQDDIPLAWNTGIFRPVIWLNSTLASSPELSAVLLHESQHIRNRDNAYLSLITLVENLFWWNPLVFFLGRTARMFQELACDDRCAREDPDYRRKLNRLILAFSPAVKARLPAAINTGMFRDKNFNVLRIQSLNRSYTMKSRHIISMGGLVLAAIMSITFVAAQENAGSREAIIRSVAEKRANDPDYVMTDKEIIAGLEEYASRLDQAYAELREENARLRRTVAELELATGD